jgi:hypothetical protein
MRAAGMTENERWSESILVFVSVSTPIHKGFFFSKKKLACESQIQTDAELDFVDARLLLP